MGRGGVGRGNKEEGGSGRELLPKTEVFMGVMNSGILLCVHFVG